MDAKNKGGQSECCAAAQPGKKRPKSDQAKTKARPGLRKAHGKGRYGKARHGQNRPHSSNHQTQDKTIYGALDLGTNNCRLLVAVPTGNRFRVIDSFSRIVRLGEGLARNGALSEAAQDRCIAALKICTDKLIRRNVTRSRLIATEACRKASNGDAFIDRVEAETGLKLEVINQETEARLALAGSAPLIDRKSRRALVFDIGGGSSELIWVNIKAPMKYEVLAWTSLPVGVITLSEKYGNGDVTPQSYEDMKSYVSDMLVNFEQVNNIKAGLQECNSHLIGTSGTVTTVAGVHLGLKQYNRNRIDGCWLQNDDIMEVTRRLLGMSIDERAANPCIGQDRADLVLAGCAILDAIRELWPSDRIRVADRGLREGILNSLMIEDGVIKSASQRRARGRRRRHKNHNRKSGEKQ